MDPSGPIPVFRYEFKFNRTFAAEIVRSVIHAVLFHRIFGPLPSKDVDVLGITFPQVVDLEIENLVNLHTQSCVVALEHKSAVLLSIRFLESRSVSQGKAPAGVWEKWEIGLQIDPSTKAYSAPSRAAEATPRRGWSDPKTLYPAGLLGGTPADTTAAAAPESPKSLELQLALFLARLIHFVFSQRLHVPPITNTDLSPFPLDISILPVSDPS